MSGHGPGKTDVVNVAVGQTKASAVQRAPAADQPDSQRYWKIDRQEKDLKGELGGLEESTKQRNREFEQKLRNIEERRRRLAASLAAELEEREENHADVMEALKMQLQEAESGIEAWVQEEIKVKYEPLIEEQEKQVAVVEEKVDHFLTATVPQVIEEQNGQVTRKLQKANETFDIENAKIAKREQKLLKRFDTHQQRSLLCFSDEMSTRQSKLWVLAEDVDEAERLDERAWPKVQLRCMTGIKEQRESIEETTAERKKNDNLVLDSMIESQEKLQECILETFGLEAEQQTRQATLPSSSSSSSSPPHK